MTETFQGFRRTDGTIGVRNLVIVMNTDAELAGLAKKMADLVSGVIPVTHQTGKTHSEEDREQVRRTLKGTAGHPNVSAALFIGFGENDEAASMVDELREEGRNVHLMTLTKNNPVASVMKQGKEWLTEAVEGSLLEKREKADIRELMIGMECGGSDAWSGVTANPSIGSFSDSHVHRGGTTILAETPEAIGAEHILAKRAVNEEVSRAFLDLVGNYEKRAENIGEDIRSANPSPGNIKSGLSTLEEKSLGCIKKGGTSPLKEVVKYAQQPQEQGFIFMDTPGYDVESVAGLAAGGAQIVLFSTGKGSPTGSPIVPVVKIGTNPDLYRNMPEHIDVNAGKILEGTYSIVDMGEEIYHTLIDVANSAVTASESHRNREFSIWRMAETM
ncbi:UxaA family hydrolase [Salibacterium sp. K-3]